MFRLNARTKTKFKNTQTKINKFAKKMDKCVKAYWHYLLLLNFTYDKKNKIYLQKFLLS